MTNGRFIYSTRSQRKTFFSRRLRWSGKAARAVSRYNGALTDGLYVSTPHPGRVRMETALVEDHPTATVGESACPECGELIPERFCTHCGEKRVEARDYSLRHFLAEALNVIANLESPIPRSFLALLCKPGLLTTEYLAGRRKRYLKPLQLFVLCNVIFFFAQPLTGFHTLTTPLSIHLNAMPYKARAQRMVGAELERRKVPLEEYRARFDAVIQNQAKSLVIVMALIFAFVLLPLYRRRYLVEHLVFATHFYSLFLLLLIAQRFVAVPAFRAAQSYGYLTNWHDSDFVFTLVFLSACGTYLYHALRRVYRQGRAMTLLKCVTLALIVAIILQIYRFVLFFTTFYSV
jgi:hypothetical protein